jgi:hypothetical protein
VNLNLAIVVDQAEPPKFVHEYIYAGPCRSDHSGKRLLIDPYGRRFRTKVVAIIGQKQEARASRISLELNSWSTKSASRCDARLGRLCYVAPMSMFAVARFVRCCNSAICDRNKSGHRANIVNRSKAARDRCKTHLHFASARPWLLLQHKIRRA